MKKVAIVVGHWPTSIDGGAYNDDLKMSEFDFNNQLAPLLASKVREHGYIPIIVYRETYSLLPEQVNDTKADICISLHCNAFDSDPHGSEVLYHYSSTNGKRLAQAIQDNVVSCLQLPDRGIKPIDYDYEGGAGDKGGWLVEKTSMPCVIVEPFFIDSNSSLESAINKLDELADAMASGIDTYMDG
ncbi:N-acetylmuramoyl-L-alanine amidase [Vibrio jasicida]|uniref:N-acetylmuramoyl-L-alanine amidase n=1 Tax=Vibrio jasicida TaxID=766224 RepID=A0ABW7JH02_9VIBR